LQSQDKLLEFMKTWGFAISFATCQPGNRSEYIHGGGAMQPAAGLKPISQCTAVRYHRCDVSFFWATVYKTVRPMLSDHCSVCMFGLSVCNVGVLWPNGWMDQDETCYRGRPLSRSHCVRWGPSPPLRCRLDVAKFSFRNRVVNEWNILDEEIISGWSLAGFKRKLDGHLRDKRGYI